jgi:tryptophan-rich sensory protein
MLMVLGIALSAGFVGWLVFWRAIRRKPISAHLVMYGLSALAGIFTIAFFMTMDIPRIAKVLGAIVLGAVLIFLAARQQRQRQPGQP